MISANLLNLLKTQDLIGPLVALMELKYGEDETPKSVYICNYQESITFETKKYEPAIFELSMPGDEGSPKLLLQFSTAQKDFDRNMLFEVLQSMRVANIKIKDFNNLTSNIFDDIVFFFDHQDVLTIGQDVWSISLSKFRILDEFFPSKRFNSIDHPTIFAKLG